MLGHRRRAYFHLGDLAGVTVMTNLADALKYNPFHGDFGDPSDREFDDKIVLVRKDAHGSAFRREAR
jgi:hypothetical protein